MRSPCSPVSPTTTPKVASVAAAIGISGTCTRRIAAVWTPHRDREQRDDDVPPVVRAIPDRPRDDRAGGDERGVDQEQERDAAVTTELAPGEPAAGDRAHDEPGHGDEPGPRRSRRVDEAGAGEDQRRGDVGGEHAEVQQARGVHGAGRQHEEQHDPARLAVVGGVGAAGSSAAGDGHATQSDGDRRPASSGFAACGSVAHGVRAGCRDPGRGDLVVVDDENVGVEEFRPDPGMIRRPSNVGDIR